MTKVNGRQFAEMASDFIDTHVFKVGQVELPLELRELCISVDCVDHTDAGYIDQIQDEYYADRLSDIIGQFRYGESYSNWTADPWLVIIDGILRCCYQDLYSDYKKNYFLNYL